MFYLLILQQSGIRASTGWYTWSYSISNRRSRQEECDAVKIIPIRDRTCPHLLPEVFCPEAESTHRVEPSWAELNQAEPSWTKSSRTEPTRAEPIRTEPRLPSRCWPLTDVDHWPALTVNRWPKVDSSHSQGFSTCQIHLCFQNLQILTQFVSYGKRWYDFISSSTIKGK